MNGYEKYIGLSNEESRNLAVKTLAEETDLNKLEEVLLHLALLTNGEGLKTLYPTLIERKIFYPGEIYRCADEHIAKQLIHLIEAGGNNTNHLLCCLAWIGTPNVIDFFLHTSRQKPQWAQNLYVLPTQYAEVAGWTIDAHQQKEMLLNPHVIALTPVEGLECSEHTIKTFTRTSTPCSFCGNDLVTMFTYAIAEQEIEWTTCLVCSCYEPLYMRIDKHGRSVWHEKNTRWKHWEKLTQGWDEVEPIKENCLVVSPEQRHPEYTASQFIAISKSQIGGYPTWVQDAEFLRCPDCGKIMHFVGQIDMEDIEEYGEGIYYFQYCADCHVTGANYQQT